MPLPTDSELLMHVVSVFLDTKLRYFCAQACLLAIGVFALPVLRACTPQRAHIIGVSACMRGSARLAWCIEKEAGGCHAAAGP